MGRPQLMIAVAVDCDEFGMLGIASAQLNSLEHARNLLFARMAHGKRALKDLARQTKRDESELRKSGIYRSENDMKLRMDMLREEGSVEWAQWAQKRAKR